MQEIEQQTPVKPEEPKTARKLTLRTFGVALVLAALALTISVYGPVLTSFGDRAAAPEQERAVLALVTPVISSPLERQSSTSAAPSSTGASTSNNQLPVEETAKPFTNERVAVFSNPAAALHVERVKKKVAKFKLAAKLAHLRFAQHLAIARAERVEAAAQLALAQPAPVEQLAAVRVPGAKPPAPVRSVAVRTKPDADVSQTPAPVLAYATPGIPEEENKSGFGGLGKIFNGLKGGLPGRGSGIAVYDISAAVVHMPDGTKLEAHSGIGHRKDNPKYSMSGTSGRRRPTSTT